MTIWNSRPELPGLSHLSEQTVSTSRINAVRLLPYFICIVVWAYAYHSSIARVVDAWLDNGPYSHGILSFGISLYICWQQRSHITFHNKINPLSVSLLLLVSIIWWLADIANVLKVEQFSVYLLLVLSIISISGWKILRILLFPCLIILLVMPVWDFFQSPLQDLSTLVTIRVLTLVDIPALLIGHQITVPGGTFIVEEACSGLGFLLTALTLAIFYTYLYRLNWLQSWKLAIIAAAIAIFANWVRILSVVLVGNYMGMDHLIVTNHLNFGWVVFAIALIPFFVISHHWFPERVSEEQAQPGEPIQQNRHLVPMPILTVCIALILIPIASQIHGSITINTNSKNWVLPDSLEGEIARIKTGNVNWSPSFIGADDYSIIKYEHNGQEFDVLVVQYSHQEQDRELINVNNRLYSTSWHEVSEIVTQPGDSSMGSIRIKTLTSGFLGKRQIAYWYIIGGIVTSHPVAAKLLEVYSVVTGNRTAVLVAIAVDNQIELDELFEISRFFYRWSDSKK